MEADCSGAVIRMAAGSLHEGEYAGGEDIPTIPPPEIVNCKLGSGPVGERVVPKVILPSFVEWEENNIIDEHDVNRRVAITTSTCR